MHQFNQRHQVEVLVQLFNSLLKQQLVLGPLNPFLTATTKPQPKQVLELIKVGLESNLDGRKLAQTMQENIARLQVHTLVRSVLVLEVKRPNELALYRLLADVAAQERERDHQDHPQTSDERQDVENVCVRPLFDQNLGVRIESECVEEVRVLLIDRETPVSCHPHVLLEFGKRNLAELLRGQIIFDAWLLKRIDAVGLVLDRGEREAIIEVGVLVQLDIHQDFFLVHGGVELSGVLFAELGLLLEQIHPENYIAEELVDFLVGLALGIHLSIALGDVQPHGVVVVEVCLRILVDHFQVLQVCNHF